MYGTWFETIKTNNNKITSLHLIFKETYHAHKTVPSNQDNKHSRQPHNDLHDDSHYGNGMCLELIKILSDVWSRKYIIQIQIKYSAITCWVS